jgi:hypothetical protein
MTLTEQQAFQAVQKYGKKEAIARVKASLEILNEDDGADAARIKYLELVLMEIEKL